MLLISKAIADTKLLKLIDTIAVYFQARILDNILIKRRAEALIERIIVDS